MSLLIDSAYYAYHLVRSAYFSTILTIQYVANAIVEKIQELVQKIFPLPDFPAHGYVGGDLFAKNIRILFVNGIRYNKDSCARAAHRISQVFNSSQVHYTYIPLTLIQVAKSIAYGARPNGCQLLLQNIKQHLTELENQKPVPVIGQHRMQRVDKEANKVLAGGERIIIIAHSGGGATIEAIQSELSEEEKDHIDVISVGSAYLFRHDCGFRHVTNVVARGDPVPYIADLFYQLTRELRELVKPPQYVGEPVNKISIDRHKFLGDAYQEALKEIKQEYEEEMLAR